VHPYAGWGHDTFVPHKNLSVPYFSTFGSHGGIFFDGDERAALAGIDQMHVFGTRWNLVAGSPLRLMLFNATTGEVRFTGQAGSARRRLTYYPHLVLSDLTDARCRLRQVVAFTATDRIVLRAWVWWPAPEPGWRIVAFGGRANTRCEIAPGGGAVRLVYPRPTAGVSQGAPREDRPILANVLFPASFDKIHRISEDAWRSLLDLAGAGPPAREAVKQFFRSAGWMSKLTEEPLGAYLAVSQPVSSEAGNPSVFDFVVQLDYDRPAREPEGPNVDKELAAAAESWRRMKGSLVKLPPWNEGDRSLLVNAVITLENQQWRPVREYAPHRATFPAKGWYNAHWLWDACFHALGYMEYDMPKAREELLLLCRYQDPQSGIIPIEAHEYDRAGSRPVMELHPLEKSIYAASQPPLLAWAAWRLFERDPDKPFLDQVYRTLQRYTRFWDAQRLNAELGLYHWGTADRKLLPASNESGWDNSPRFDDGAETWAAIDLNCYLVNHLQATAKIADALGDAGPAREWRERADRLARRINDFLYDPRQQCYADLRLQNREPSTVTTPAMFLPMWSGIATPERARAMVDAYLIRPDHFRPLLPTVSYSHAKYNSSFYWRGPTWINVVYLVLCGLHRYGFHRERDALRDAALQAIRSNRHFAEYYDSRTGRGLGRIPYSWTAAIAIKLLLDDYAVV
jgi:hypothetical protein